ncbi:MAG: hypothetical protein ACK5PF_04910, partial [bacterium]
MKSRDIASGVTKMARTGWWMESDRLSYPTRIWTPAMMANNHRHKRFSDGAYRKKLGRYGDILGTSVSKFRVIQCASGRFLGGLGL